MILDDKTLQDCIDEYDQLGKGVILSGGHVVGFEKEDKESPATWPGERG